MKNPAKHPAFQLFLVLFASQAAVSTLSPLLGEMARDLQASPSVLGQLRSVSGLCAGLTALWLASGRSPEVELRTLMLFGLASLAGGVLITVVAPNLALLIVAQAPLGVGVAVTVSGATAAAGEWADPGAGPSVLAWALTGQPAAWVIGLPVVGLAAAIDWRLSWVVVPLAASVLAMAVLAARPRTPSAFPRLPLRDLLENEGVAAWAVGELLAYSAWTGVLVYVGALFVETYGVSVGRASFLLAGAAAAYAAGNLWWRRWLKGSTPSVLVGLGLAAAVGTGLLGLVRPHPAASFAIFAALAFAAAGRALGGAVVGFRVAPGVAGMSLRTASLQLGYLVGSTLGGIAIAIGGYSFLGVALGALFVPAVLPYLLVSGLRRSRPRADQPAVSASAVAACP